MDRSFNSSSGSLSGSHHADASQILKELLNVGKPSQMQQAYSSPGNGAAHQSMDGDTVDSPGTQGRSPQDISPAGGDSANPRSLVDTVRQTIVLRGDDRSGSVPVYGRDVIIKPSEASKRDSSAPGSSKVKITPVVKYDWEHKYYIGNLVAVNQIYLVYVLKIQSGFGLRILDRRTSVRALLKGFEDIITDVAFAHHQSNILGCIDRLGNLTVWQIYDTEGKIMPNPKLKVTRPAGTQPTDYHRLVWCPYLPDDPTASDNSSISDENSRLLAVTHDEKAEFWDLDVVVELYGNVVNANNVTDGVIRVYDGHTKPITDLSVAPDGQVLATASEDGTVKFWQLDMAAPDQAPSRLHRFSPHEGKPLSALIFCDNHKYQDPDLPFWRFLITGACSNRELMMWCTVTWTCLQKINFSQPGLIPEPFLKIKLDLSASFLIVTDVTRKVMYVLQVHQDHQEGHADMSSITDFLLTQPTLSFAIVDAGKCRLKPLTEEGEEGEELNSGDLLELIRGDASANQSRSNGVVVKMFCVNSRSVQDLQVRFQPNPSIEQANTAGSVSSASQDGYALQDGLSDMSMNETDCSVRASYDLTPSHLPSSMTPGSMTSSFTSESTNHSSQPYLMTPDAIKSSSAKTLAEHLRESNSSTSSFTQISAMNASVDELLGSHNSSDHTHVMDSETPVNINQFIITSLPATPMSPKNIDPLTPSALPQPEDISHQEEYASEDEGPKSPPPTPTELASPELIARSTASTEDLAGRLESARLKEKRISDSSAEVAQILQSHMDQTVDQDNEDERRDDEDDDDKDDDDKDDDDKDEEDKDEEDKDEDEEDEEPIPVVQDAIPINGRQMKTEEPEEKILEEENPLNWGKGNTVSPVQETEQPGKEDNIMIDYTTEGSQGREVVIIGPKHDGEGYDRQDVIQGEEAAPREGDTAKATQSDDDGREHQGSGAMAPLPQQLLEVQEQDSCSEHSSDIEPADSTSPPGARSKTRKQRRDKLSRSSPRPRRSLPLDGETRGDMPEITNTLQQVLSLLQSQQQELKQMKQDIAKSQQANSIIQSMRSRIDKLDKSLCTKMEATMAKQSEQERQRLNSAMQERQSLDKQKQERLLECVSQNLNKSVTSRLDKTVRTEIENKVVPEIGKLISPMSEQLNTIMSQKLTATDQLMKENIGKLVKSRSTAEAIGQSAANALSGTIQTTYRDTFRSSVVPAFEQSCQSLFQQVNTAFEAGTRQYTHQLETHLTKLRQKERESRDPILAELISLVESFKAGSEALKESVLSSVQSELDKQLQKSNEKLEQDILTKVRKLLKEELQAALRDHQSNVESSIAAVVRSQAPTPVPQGPDIRQVQSQITHLLQQGQIIQAFQSALSASDLRAVLFVCHAVNPDQLFGSEPCPLDQPVLLSLIQQLSHDLGSTTMLKLRYIEESLIVLNEDKTTTQYHEHLPIVIGDLCLHITTFLQQHPSHANTKQMKRLLMLAQSLK